MTPRLQWTHLRRGLERVTNRSRLVNNRGCLSADEANPSRRDSKAFTCPIPQERSDDFRDIGEFLAGDDGFSRKRVDDPAFTRCHRLQFLEGHRAIDRTQRRLR